MRNRGRLLRFGAKLATRGVIARLGLFICVVTCLWFCGRAFVLAHRHVPSVYYVPSIAEAALVWGGGFCVAFGAALSALRRDRKDGTFDLVVGRAGSPRAYVFTRAGGLVLLLAIVNVAGALLVGIACAAAAENAHAALYSLWVAGASSLFGIAAAFVVGLVCFAALGVSGRVGGYGRLFAVLIVPEMVRRLALAHAPSDAVDVMSISSALAGLRQSLLPHMLDAPRLLRSLFVVLVVGGLALAVVRRDAARAAAGADGESP
jgi:hypothetical protein